MSNIRASHAHDMLNEQVIFVDVIFDTKLSSEDVRTNKRRAKTYTYKTLKDTVKLDDFVVVETKQGEYYNDDNLGSDVGWSLFKVVRVVAVKTVDEVDMSVPFDYGWVVATLDLEAHRARRAGEEKFVSEYNKLRTKNLRKQLTMAVLSNVDEGDTQALLALVQPKTVESE